jgi:hypothetical protein
MEQQYREMFDEVRSSGRLREEVTRMTKMEQRPARGAFPKDPAGRGVAGGAGRHGGGRCGHAGDPAAGLAQEWQETTGTVHDASQMVALIDEIDAAGGCQ